MQNLRNENCLVVPPINQISGDLNYLGHKTAITTLVVPLWPSTSFWPLLNTTFVEYIYDHIQALGKEVLKHGRNKNCLFGSDRFIGYMIAVCMDFMHPRSEIQTIPVCGR